MFDENLLRNYALPESAVSKRELRYDPRKDIWPVSAPGLKRLYLSCYREKCTPQFLQSLKLALIALNGRLQPKTVKNYLEIGLNPLLERLSRVMDEIRTVDLERYWLDLPPERMYWLKHLRPLCEALALHGVPGHSIAPEALDYIGGLHLGNNETGAAVWNWCPVKGPLTPDELDVFLRALHAGWAQGEITTEDYMLILLFASFGARTANLADLKVCDLKITQEDDIQKYALSIPSVKQQGGKFRERFYTRKLEPGFGVFLEAFIEDQRQKYRHLGCGDQLPLFVDLKNKDLKRTYHRITNQLQSHAVRTAKRLAVVSPRTGKPLHVNTRRYRYTAATLARAFGMDPSAIAALLDHGSLETQELYAAISPEVLVGITERLQSDREPLAAAFLGRVAEPGEILEPQAVVFRVRFRKDIPYHVLGGCEASRKCGGRRPYCCYPCPKFTASMEGDHEGALADLLEERVKFDQDAGDGLRFMTADSVAKAIRKVIAMVQERLKKMGKPLEQIRQEKADLLRERVIL